MFNIFKAEKASKQLKQKHQSQQKLEEWNHRYKTQMQPALVKQFNRRINGFAKKMQDQPVIIQNRKQILVQEALAREYDKSLNISNQLFRFKNTDDWKSIFSPLQRSQRQRMLRKIGKQSYFPSKNTKVKLKLNENKRKNNNDSRVKIKTQQSTTINQFTHSHINNNTTTLQNQSSRRRNMSHNISNIQISQQMLFRSMLSQSKFCQTKVQYRIRSKDKQINPPMKYTNKNSQFVLASLLPKINKKNRNGDTDLSNKFNDKRFSLNASNSNTSDDKQIPQNMSYADIDISSLQHSQILRKNPQHVKTQLQLIEQQQMKALAQKRLYFKSLIEMQQNVRTAKQKHNLKQILVKCGVFKPSSGKVYEEEEIDKFMEMMKTKY